MTTGNHHAGHGRHVAAQPWPFPGALMLGFIAEVAADQPILLSDEIEDTVWSNTGWAKSTKSKK